MNSNPHPRAPRNILIVEDEPLLIELLKETLAPLCDVIYTSANGLEALAILAAHPDICAILSDIRMPSMTGLQLLTEIRSQYNPIPFVVLTGFGDAAAYRQAIKLNATDFLEKPFKSLDIKEVMQKAIDYGIELQRADQDLNRLIEASTLPRDEINRLRRLKRTVLAMRIESQIYIKKSSA